MQAISGFKDTLANEYGVKREEEWHNNNSTLKQQAYVIDLKKISQGSDIIYRVYQYNRDRKNQPIVIVPVAGWKMEVPTEGVSSFFQCWSSSERKERLTAEYAQSFSLSRFTTAVNADLVLRVSRVAQQHSIIHGVGGTVMQVTPGYRIIDADDMLHAHALALPPNMPTLHVASIVGAAANGCYGPARDHGPMTTNIVEMKVVTPLGDRITLSSRENSKLFAIFRDCHLSAGFFVEHISLGNIVQDYLMKRHSILYHDVPELMVAMMKRNPLHQEHFIAMYIPVDIKEKHHHAPRIRITTCAKTYESISDETKCRETRELGDYIKLMKTEAGEPIIDLVTRSESLRSFYPFILKTAALETYGTERETTEIDYSAQILHIFKTYTDLPIADINWLIQVNSTDEARSLLLELLQITEDQLVQYAEQEQYPLFNAFARYLKGLCDPDGTNGIAPTLTDQPHQSILSFELLSYTPLAETKAFKELVNKIVTHLKVKKFKFKYHPGKTMPDDIRSLTQYFTDPIDMKRLQNFQRALEEIHGGRDNLAISPFLTPQKREFLGLAPIEEQKEKKTLICSKSGHCTKKEEKAALKGIIKIAKDHKDAEVERKAKETLALV